MSLFGWDYPPGCNSVPGDEDIPCEVCGRDCAECICPECPVCTEQGYSQCYIDGHLTKTNAQIKSLKAAEAAWESEAASEWEAHVENWDKILRNR